MLEKLDNVVFSNDIYFDYTDSDIVIFFSHGTGHNTMDLNNINIDYDNFDEDNPTNVVLVRLIA